MIFANCERADRRGKFQFGDVHSHYSNVAALRVRISRVVQLILQLGRENVLRYH
jgi:hypothetical protein